MGSTESTPGREIGSRSSDPCVILTTANETSSKDVIRGHFGRDFLYSHEERVGLDKQPRIVFGNLSSYRVSYWAIEEHKAKPCTSHKRLVNAMEDQLETGNNGTSHTASGQETRERTETVEAAENACFLMRDGRIEPGAANHPPIEVQFPKDCKELRVFGYFEEDGQWKIFKDKVYSICWFRKVFALTACDASIALYTKGRNDNVPVRTWCCCRELMNGMVYKQYGTKLRIRRKETFPEFEESSVVCY